MRGAIVPHAPVLVEGIAGRREAEAEPFRKAVAHIGAGMQAEDTIVLVSCHGSSSGRARPDAKREGCVYRRPSGDLSASGIPGHAVEGHGDQAIAETIAARSGLPLIDLPADHGIVVPLLLDVSGTAAVVGVSVASPEEARKVARAVGDLDVAVVASAHLGAGLDGRAPLTLLPEGVDLEARVVADADRDCAVFADTAADMAAKAGSCSADVLLFFGTVFAGRPLEIHRYGHPFGVGYLVGSVGRQT